MSGSFGNRRSALLAARVHRHDDGHPPVRALGDALDLDPPLLPRRLDVVEVLPDPLVAEVRAPTDAEDRVKLDLGMAHRDRGVTVAASHRVREGARRLLAIGSHRGTKVTFRGTAMSGPVILAVDDERDCLRDVERELFDRYARDYRVICTHSAPEALELLERLAEAGEDLALVLAGQWLSGTTGSELLGRVRQLHPHAKRGLLIAWGGWGDKETGEAIFDSMAHGRIDYYVLRPSGKPDELFHQAVSGFLLEWARARRIAPHTIRVVGEVWSGRAYELRETLGRCAIPHSFCLADSSEGRALVGRERRGREATPDRPSRRNRAGRPDQCRACQGRGLTGRPRAE